jgi:hypothetical protein
MNTIIKILVIGCLYYFVANPIFLVIGRISEPLLWIILTVGFSISLLIHLVEVKYNK